MQLPRHEPRGLNKFNLFQLDLTFIFFFFGDYGVCKTTTAHLLLLPLLQRSWCICSTTPLYRYKHLAATLFLPATRHLLLGYVAPPYDRRLKFVKQFLFRASHKQGDLFSLVVKQYSHNGKGSQLAEGKIIEWIDNSVNIPAVDPPKKGVATKSKYIKKNRLN